jgi:hypothetical protein
MQNRSMFPFRRHGSKKRSKGGAHGGSARKSRGPQRPLPNSARDLLPMLQPATKALAQVLAGRAGASGQLNHARNLLAHAERLINDRVHNRLIPAEREEFFEQLARLRLTLADADAEAQVQAAEEQVERQPPPPPVARERLKEMALSLSRPERDRSRSPRPAEEVESAGDDQRSTGTTVDETAGAAAPAEQQEKRPLRPLADLPGRLVLSRTGGESAHRAIGQPVALRRARATAAAPVRHSQPIDAAPDGDPAARTESISPDPTGGNGSSPAVTAEPRRRIVRRTRKTKDGLPEGWVVDEDGYVVPRHD